MHNIVRVYSFNTFNKKNDFSHYRHIIMYYENMHNVPCCIMAVGVMDRATEQQKSVTHYAE